MPSFPTDIVVSTTPTATRYERLRYFNGLFLEEGDFATEQSYFLSVRRFLNYLLFDEGRLFEVTGTMPLQVSSVPPLRLLISPGSALIRDTVRRLGYEITLPAQNIDLSTLTSPLLHNQTLTVTLAHLDTEFTSPTGVSGVPAPQADRVQEQGVIHVILPGDPLPPGPQITLATVTATSGTGVPGSPADTLNVNNTTVRGGVRLQILSQSVLAALSSGGAAPTIATFTASGPVGSAVVINGTSLAGATGIRFNLTPGVIAANTPTQVNTTVPVGATTGPITLQFPGGVTAASPGNFTVTVAVPAPTITGFAPTSGAALSTVTITGTNFTGATSVTFGGVAAATFSVDSATQITAAVPAGAVTGPVVVSTPGGSVTSAAVFTVVVPPAFSLNLNAQASGAQVLVNGSNIHFAGLAIGVDAATQLPPNNTVIRLLSTGPAPAFVDVTSMIVRPPVTPNPQQLRITMPPRPTTWPINQAVTVRITFRGASTDVAGALRYDD